MLGILWLPGIWDIPKAIPIFCPATGVPPLPVAARDLLLSTGSLLSCACRSALEIEQWNAMCTRVIAR